MKLLCLPYAGGTAIVYKQKLSKYIDKKVELIPVELPGRGIRMQDELITDFKMLLEDLLQEVLQIISKEEEYALLGYSMGCKLVYEMYYHLIERGYNQPKVIFMCAANPPDIPVPKRNINRELVINEMKYLGGTSKMILQNEQLMSIFVPIMSADLQVLQSYQYEPNRDKIKVPLVIQYGIDDKQVLGEINRWSEFTESTCEFYKYQDGHFFIFNYLKEFAVVINSKLG